MARATHTRHKKCLKCLVIFISEKKVSYVYCYSSKKNSVSSVILRNKSPTLGMMDWSKNPAEPTGCVGWYFSGIPVNPQHNGRACSTEKRRRVKYVMPFCWLKFLRMVFYVKVFQMHFYAFFEIFRTGVPKQFWTQNFLSTKAILNEDCFYYCS